MIIVPYRAEHMAALELQQGQSWGTPFLTKEHAQALETLYAFTAMADGKVVGVGGVMELWPHRALLWSFIDRRAGPHFLAIHRATRRFLDALPYRRIEAEVDCDFEPGHRWLHMLGFEMEAPRMRAYRIDGGDSALYARVK